ncbi:MAG: AEC family transporter [Chloroflexi bacterium]|nr:AEC family transporter [Chloroflexota bacterium]
MPLLNIFANNLLPVLLLAGAGFALGKTLKVSPRPLGRVVFYVFSPILVFDLITRSQLPPGRIALMMGFAACLMLTAAGLAFMAGKLLRLERAALTAVVLTTMIGNNGNYGLPVIAFAFGQEALAYASIYFVTSNVMLYSLGVFTASLGHMRPKDALLGLLKVPAIYAILLGMVFVRTGWVLPDPLQRTVTLAAGAAVPCMLILLGLELQRAEWSRNLRALGIPVFLRLAVGPFLALGLAALFGLQGPARQAGVTEAGMPSAVMTTIVASEYDLEPSLVTAIVFVSTILSPLTLTPLLYFLGK